MASLPPPSSTTGEVPSPPPSLDEDSASGLLPRTLQEPPPLLPASADGSTYYTAVAGGSSGSLASSEEDAPAVDPGNPPWRRGQMVYFYRAAERLRSPRPFPPGVHSYPIPSAGAGVQAGDEQETSVGDGPEQENPLSRVGRWLRYPPPPRSPIPKIVGESSGDMEPNADDLGTELRPPEEMNPMNRVKEWLQSPRNEFFPWRPFWAPRVYMKGRFLVEEIPFHAMDSFQGGAGPAPVVEWYGAAEEYRRAGGDPSSSEGNGDSDGPAGDVGDDDRRRGSGDVALSGDR